MVFIKKKEIFPSFYSRKNRSGKCVERYSRKKKASLDYKTTTKKKSKN